MIASRFASVAFAFFALGSFRLGAVEKRLPMKGEVFAIGDRSAFLHSSGKAWRLADLACDNEKLYARNLKEVLCIGVKCPSCPSEPHQRDPHLTRNCRHLSPSQSGVQDL